LPADDAIVIDSSATPIDAVFAKVMADVNARLGI
jgi:cytidylate kinase